MSRKPLTPPLRMVEVAELFGWVASSSSKTERRTAAARALRMLRRIEKQKGCRLLFPEKTSQRGGLPIYTTITILQRHCGELVDVKAYVDRQLGEMTTKHLARLRALEAGQRALASRLRQLARK